MRPLALVAALLPATAFAAWPAEVVVSGMAEHRGRPVPQPEARAGYDQVVRALGAAIANKPVAPARTLGSAGFDVSLGLSATVLDTEPGDDGALSGWALATERTGAALVLPSLTVRKGLPGSVELGATASWIGGSRQGVVAGYLRAAPLEGMDPLPDISVQVGYAHYVGNPELLLGTLDLGATVGTTLPFGSGGDVRQASVSPFLGAGALLTHARARVNPSAEAAVFGVGPDGEGSDDDPTRTPLTALPQITLGVHLTNNTALARLSGAIVPGVGPSIHGGVGFMF